MKDLFIPLLLTFTYASIMECPIYECDTLPEDQCVSVKEKEGNKEYRVQPCKKPLVCDTSSSTFPWHCKRYARTKLPGEYNENQEECISNISTNSTCQGLSEGSDCNQDKECNYGLYCNKKCMKTLKEDESCDEENKCGAFLVCNGKCIKMGSLENDAATIDSRACNSFYSLNNTCKPGPILIKSKQKFGPTVCTGMCFYKTDDKHLILNCTCGRSNLGVAYCNPGKGDFNLDTVIPHNILVLGLHR